ncbi:unnamed protein product [Cladocopium goreaui]|uniref:Reverse transcriptase domain-containing protein n=2 Tax=Cladocopium goreaui TaxID=2562237 RepID=A0A9P1BLK3_9DINO|nr:unnamed protein product [Cladocopium goreaui]
MLRCHGVSEKASRAMPKGRGAMAILILLLVGHESFAMWRMERRQALLAAPLLSQVPWGSTHAEPLLFDNAVQESKDQIYRNFGLKPNIGLQVRKLDRKGRMSDGPVLRACQEQVIPRCFSSTEDFFREKKVETKLEPWRIPSGTTPEEAIQRLKQLVESYPPGHDGIDSGGCRLLQVQPRYLYAQFASFIGLISDVEFAVSEDGLVQLRSALRSMAPDALGTVQTPPDSLVNAKRLNWFSERLRKAGWTAPEITEQTHPQYFAENLKAGLKTIGLEFMPEKDGVPKPDYL